MTSTALDALPLEICDDIASRLSAHDVTNVRLTSRSLSSLFAGPTFKSLVSHQTVDLTQPSLESFCALAAHPTFGSVVRSVTVVAKVYGPATFRTTSNPYRETQPQSIAERQSYNRDTLGMTQDESDWTIDQLSKQLNMRLTGSDRELLTKAFHSLGQIDSLTLAASRSIRTGELLPVSHGDNWHPIWIQATHTFTITMTAMAHTSLRVSKLDIYATVQRCSLPVCDLTLALPSLIAGGFDLLGPLLEELSLSASTWVQTYSSDLAAATANYPSAVRDDPILPQSITSVSISRCCTSQSLPDNYLGLARLLQHMPFLTSLDLHMYKTVGPVSEYPKVFAEIAELVFLPRLRSCKLRGLYISYDSITQFLNKHAGLEHLELRSLHLWTGDWAQVLFYLSQQMPKLNYLVLSLLEDMSQLWTLRDAEAGSPEELERSVSFGEQRRVHTAIFSTRHEIVDEVGLLTPRSTRDSIVHEIIHRAGLLTPREVARAQRRYVHNPDLWRLRNEERAEYGPPIKTTPS